MRKADLTPLYVPIVLKSGSLNLLEHSGPVQACNGIALPVNKVAIEWFVDVLYYVC